MKTKVNWVNKFYLEGETGTGHIVKMDSAAAGAETKGPTPKELLLQALAGCTMMDVAVILEKSRKHMEKFWIDVEAELAAEHPRIFTLIHLKYNFIGKDLDDNSVKRAIELSKEKYCAISNLFKKEVDLTYSYEIKNILVEEENLINQ
jgi:putative redox protein